MHTKKLHKHACFNVRTKTLSACGDVYARIFCSLIIEVFAKYDYKQRHVCDNLKK